MMVYILVISGSDNGRKLNRHQAVITRTIGRCLSTNQQSETRLLEISTSLRTIMTMNYNKNFVVQMENHFINPIELKS